jgi:UDP-N-acetylmuramate--alanine ligase
MSYSNIHSVYFIGIGGIGMSALARYFNANDTGVAGYDRVSSSLTDDLVNEGIEIHFEDDPNGIPGDFLEVPVEKALVVYTPAIPSNHKELKFLKDGGYRILKRSEVLAEITLEKFTIAVAGTHGKTTVTSMIAHLLMKSQINFTAFIGGILQSYESNYLEFKGKGKEIMVVEADEFDRSFHLLRPDIAVITSVEPDHLDIYESQSKIEDAFLEFADGLKPNGKLLVHQQVLPLFREAISYGTDGDFNYSISNLGTEISKIQFNTPRGDQWSVEISASGLHNIENAVAGLAVGQLVGLEHQALLEGLRDFPGVKRRFEKVFEREELIFIDDYAHHPTELKASISAVKKLYPDKFLTVVFQPHLFSRTRDFASAFAASLDLADEVFLMEIYAAREEPIEGISSKNILEKMNQGKARVLGSEEILQLIGEKREGVIMTLGAGDIDRLVKPIKEILTGS